MYQVSSRLLEEQPTLVMTATLTVAEISSFLGKAYAAVAEQAGRSGQVMTGPPFARYRPLDPEFARCEVEAGFPVDRLVPVSGEVEASTLPSGLAAVVTHVGPYDEMKPAYAATETWITEHDGVTDGSAWEVYFTDPQQQPDPSTWRTEIVQPFKPKITASASAM